MKYIIFCESQTNMDLFADERYTPESESFFSGVLAQRINDTSFNHISVLKKLQTKLVGRCKDQYSIQILWHFLSLI